MGQVGVAYLTEETSGVGDSCRTDSRGFFLKAGQGDQISRVGGVVLCKLSEQESRTAGFRSSNAAISPCVLTVLLWVYG